MSSSHRTGSPTCSGSGVLARVATTGADGMPHVAPVGRSDNPDLVVEVDCPGAARSVVHVLEQAAHDLEGCRNGHLAHESPAKVSDWSAVADHPGGAKNSSALLSGSRKDTPDP